MFGYLCSIILSELVNRLIGLEVSVSSLYKNENKYIYGVWVEIWSLSICVLYMILFLVGDI